MKWSHLASVGFVVLVSGFLLGSKKPIQNHDHSVNKHHRSAQQKQTKPLDLTLPSREISFQDQPENVAVVQSKSDYAAPESTLSKTRPIELQGRVIMSQEPEIEKTKTADGAGIMINLRH